MWSKLIGGYLVFVVPFLVSLLFGLLMLVWQGFPLGEPEIFPRVLSLIAVSLLYIGVFFAIGTVISTYLDNSKTALILAFTVWVFAVLITPRVGFLAAKFIAPTQTLQSVYLEKTAFRENFNAELEKRKQKIHEEFWKSRSKNQPQPTSQADTTSQADIEKSLEAHFASGFGATKEMDKQVKPVEEEFRQKFKEGADAVDRRYKRGKSATRSGR